MNRKALIISNPGESGATNYCKGVLVDVENYATFLKSPLGGYWDDLEIQLLNRPQPAQVQTAISNLATKDYALIIFCGHGYYSTFYKSTMIELGSGNTIDSIELRKNARKRTIILDCCRKAENDIVTESLVAMMAKAETNVLNPADCKRYYNKAIENCANGIVVCYGCSMGETAGDSESKGGYYSYSLLQATRKWRSSNRNMDLSKNYDSYSIVRAHIDSCSNVRGLSGGNQNPEIEKPRSEPYFPFAIVA